MKKKEIRPIRSLDHEITLPGSKSCTARALVISALASGETLLQNPLFSEDTGYMIEGLRALGVPIEKIQGNLRIKGSGGTFNPTTEVLYLGGAGTAVRFLTTVAGLTQRPIVIDGNSRMRERPIQDLLDGLKPLGIKARCIDGNGCPPVLVEASQFEGGRTQMEGEKSSQFHSSILLCSPYARREVIVETMGDLVSRSYVNLTIEIMKEFGGKVSVEDGRRYRVQPGPYLGRTYSIEGDLSSASYFLAAAAITGGRILVKGARASSKQGEKGFINVLESMGCLVHWGDQMVEVTGRDLHAVEVDMKTMPDTVQTLAVVAAFAKGWTRILNVHHLRYKETDRLTALRKELSKIGIATLLEKDALLIQGGNPRGVEIETYQDHRMAMAFAVLGLRVPGMVIQDPDCVNKSMPTFWALLEGLR